MRNADSPFKITDAEAKDILDKSPAVGAALPVEPIGKISITSYV